MAMQRKLKAILHWSLYTVSTPPYADFRMASGLRDVVYGVSAASSACVHHAWEPTMLCALFPDVRKADVGGEEVSRRRKARKARSRSSLKEIDNKV